MKDFPVDPKPVGDKKVAVIGAGPVGLMTAVLLQQRGANVTVYERDADAGARRYHGGTLDIHAETGQRALAAAGLLFEFRQLARPTGERFADEQGNILIDEPVNEHDLFGRPEIDRGDLHRMLLAALEPGTVQWNHNFLWLEREDDQYILRFANQPDQVAEVVIGANGGRSRVRPYVTEALPEYSGSFGIQGEVAPELAPAFAALVNGGNLMARHGGKALFVHAKANGSLHYYVSFRKPLTWLAEQGLSNDPEQIQSVLAEEMADWAPLYHQAFQVTEAFELLPIFRLPLSPERAVAEPIALVGDAAHLMPPYAGVGVNMGLMDALLLADNLTSGQYDTVEHAIEAYEQVMYRYAHEAQMDTEVSELALHDHTMTWDQVLEAARG